MISLNTGRRVRRLLVLTLALAGSVSGLALPSYSRAPFLSYGVALPLTLNPSWAVTGGLKCFGYLRRDPEAAGYDDWVDVLENGRGAVGPRDYRHMIFGFIYSTEYRGRFSQP